MCNSLNSILQTALARLDVSDAERHPIVGFECNDDVTRGVVAPCLLSAGRTGVVVAVPRCPEAKKKQPGQR
jgi:hypothetical protein